MTTRRDFLKIVSAGAAGYVFDRCAVAVGREAPNKKRPNFLFILTDDQRWDILGVVQREQGGKARFPWFKTPNLDKLAEEGVRFRNAFVVNSLCAPSRASFLTGQYGYQNGIRDNRTDFPAGNVTHASVLRAAGYTTGYIGKWHMDGQSGQRPGFDYSASFVGQGKYFDCPVEINGQKTETKGWVDDVSTDYALGFLQKNKDKPFLLSVGFKACHGPFTPPPRHEKTFEGEQARSVPNLSCPAIFHAEKSGGKKAGNDGSVPVNLGYFRCLAAMDDNVGRILGELGKLGLTENTVVVFAGDNGYYLGEHMLGDKRSAYEESLRIPMLMRYPAMGLKGKLVDQMVLNIDLAPTFIDLVGVEVPKTMQGRSWKYLLEGNVTDWRKEYYYEYFSEKGFGSPHVRAIRTEHAKLIKYPNHEEWTELFDLTADPYEIKNLINDAAHAELKQKLESEFKKQAEAAGCDLSVAIPVQEAVAEKKKRGKKK